MAAAHQSESIDSCLALRAYAVLIGVGGFVLAATGQAWFGSHLAELPWGRAVIIRMTGAIMVAAAVGAWGLSTTDAFTRRRGLTWFAGAHVVVWLMLAAQARAPLGGFGLAEQAVWALLMVILGLLGVRYWDHPAKRPPLTISPLGLSVPPDDGARDAHEQQIREAAAQEERNRLARDLHDAVKQQIFAIQTSAATAEARFASDPEGAREALGQVRQSAREASAEMEALLEQLRVAPLGNTGLVEAIRKQCEALAFRTGADVQVHVDPLPPEHAMPPGAHQAIFRIVQEALANVARHARAQHVWVSLHTTPRRLEVQVRDDGCGVAGDAPRTGMGLHNMRARAAEIGATVAVTPAEAVGTLATLSVPYESFDSIRYRRRRALGLAALFGWFSAVGVVSLMNHGFVPSNVLLVFLALAFVHYVHEWWSLRRLSPGGGVEVLS
jgi:signal transduction histidine kinase